MKSLTVLNRALDAAQRVVDCAWGLEEAFNPSEYGIAESDFLGLANALRALDDAPPSPLPSIFMGITDDGLPSVTVRRGTCQVDLHFTTDGVAFFFCDHDLDRTFNTILPADVGRYLTILFNVPV